MDSPLLICPFCLKEIPLMNIRIDPESKQIILTITCNCLTSSSKSLPLDKYLSLLKSKSSSSSSLSLASLTSPPQCPKHSFHKSIKYCSNCFQWMCPTCIITHQQLHASHVVLSNELHLSCIHHKSNLIVYCSQCRLIICRHCKEKEHKTHHTEEVKENIVNGLRTFLKDFSQIQAILEENSKAYATFEQLIIANIKQQQQWLIEIKELYECNAMLNAQLNELCTVMITTGSLMKDVVNYPMTMLFDGVVINKADEVMFERGQMEKGYMMLKERYKEMFILKFKSNDEDDAKENKKVKENVRKKINKRTYECLKTIEGHSKAIYCIRQLRDGRIISGACNGNLRVWDTENEFKCIGSFDNDGNAGNGIGKGINAFAVNCIIQLDNGIILTGLNDSTIRINDIIIVSSETMTLPLVSVLKGHNDSVNCLIQLNSNNNSIMHNCIASGSNDCTIKIWDMFTYDCIFTITGHRNGILSIAHLTGNYIVSASNDHTIKLWNNQTYEYITTMTDHKYSVCCVIQLEDGRLASASSDCSIILWDITSYDAVEHLKGHSNTVYVIVQLEDGRLASASSDCSIKLWDILTGKCIVTMDGMHCDVIYSLTKMIDGRLASASWDKTICIWDV